MKKKILVALLAATMSLSMTACGGTETENTSTDTVTEDIVSDESKTTEADETVNDDSADLAAEENTAIELIAGEQGEYGKLITMSAGTDMEESFYAYYIPAGSYTVTNEGEYMTQISVYGGFAKNEETGYDEYTDVGDIVLLDAGEEASVEISEGWFVEIQEPTHISLAPAN